MSWNIAVLLVLLWVLGLVNNCTMSGFIHILPAIAVIAILTSIIQNRRFTQPEDDSEQN